MKLLKENVRTRCDIGRCMNLADHVIDVDGIPRHNIHICTSCLNELYNTIGVAVKPHSVENVVRRAENKRNEWKRK